MKEPWDVKVFDKVFGTIVVKSKNFYDFCIIML